MCTFFKKHKNITAILGLGVSIAAFMCLVPNKADNNEKIVLLALFVGLLYGLAYNYTEKQEKEKEMTNVLRI